MFNRKLKERVAKLEELVDGVSESTIFDWYGHPFGTRDARPGIRDKVDALASNLGVAFEKTPDVKGQWVAVPRKKAQ